LIGTDNTARKQAEEALLKARALQSAEETLRTSEVRYRRLFEAARDGILILDAGTGMIVDVNPFLIKMLGYSREVFLGKKVWELGCFKDILANQDNFTELQQKGYVRYEDKPLETSDGRRIEVEIVSYVYLENHHKLIQCNIRDISERKWIQEALRQQTEELRARNEELTSFNRAAVGRELRMIELKQEVNELCQRLGESPRHVMSLPLGGNTSNAGPDPALPEHVGTEGKVMTLDLRTKKPAVNRRIRQAVSPPLRYLTVAAGILPPSPEPKDQL
jgi:PAS domain S-box-containing protein